MAAPLKYSKRFDDKHVIRIASNPDICGYEGDDPVVKVNWLTPDLLGLKTRYYSEPAPPDPPVPLTPEQIAAADNAPRTYVEKDKVETIVEKEKQITVEFLYRPDPKMSARVILKKGVSAAGVAKKIELLDLDDSVGSSVGILKSPPSVQLQYADESTREKCEALYRSAVAVSTIFFRGYGYFIPSIMNNGSFTDASDTIAAAAIRKNLDGVLTESNIALAITKFIAQSTNIANVLVPPDTAILFATPLTDDAVAAYAVYLFKQIDDYDVKFSLNNTLYRLANVVTEAKALTILKNFRTAFVEFMKSPVVHATVSYLYTNVVPLSNQPIKKFTSRTAEFAHRADGPPGPPGPPLPLSILKTIAATAAKAAQKGLEKQVELDRNAEAAAAAANAEQSVELREELRQAAAVAAAAAQQNRDAQVALNEAAATTAAAVTAREAQLQNQDREPPPNSRIYYTKLTTSVQTKDRVSLLTLAAAIYAATAVNGKVVVDTLEDNTQRTRVLNVEIHKFLHTPKIPGIEKFLNEALRLPASFAREFSDQFAKNVAVVRKFKEECEELYSTFIIAAELKKKYDIASAAYQVRPRELEKLISDVQNELNLLAKEFMYEDETVVDANGIDARNVVDIFPLGEKDILDHLTALRAKMMLPISDATKQAKSYIQGRNIFNVEDLKKPVDERQGLIPLNARF